MRNILDDGAMKKIAIALTVCIGDYYRDPAHRKAFGERQSKQ